MSDFKAKMRQIVCRLGLRPTPPEGAFFAALPRPPSWIIGSLLLREGRGGREGEPLLSRYTPIHYILDGLYGAYFGAYFREPLSRYTDIHCILDKGLAINFSNLNLMYITDRFEMSAL